MNSSIPFVFEPLFFLGNRARLGDHTSSYLDIGMGGYFEFFAFTRANTHQTGAGLTGSDPSQPLAASSIQSEQIEIHLAVVPKLYEVS